MTRKPSVMRQMVACAYPQSSERVTAMDICLAGNGLPRETRERLSQPHTLKQTKTFHVDFQILRRRALKGSHSVSDDVFSAIREVEVLSLVDRVVAVFAWNNLWASSFERVGARQF